MSNFRPLFNLPFISKLLENLSSQLQVHLSANNLFDLYQSGFRSGHDTETALLKMTNDLISADSGYITVLTLLDLTSAVWH